MIKWLRKEAKRAGGLCESLMKSETLNKKSQSDIVSILHGFDETIGFSNKFDYTMKDWEKGKAYLNRMKITDVGEEGDNLERANGMLLDFQKQEFIDPNFEENNQKEYEEGLADLHEARRKNAKDYYPY